MKSGINTEFPTPGTASLKLERCEKGPQMVYSIGCRAMTLPILAVSLSQEADHNHLVTRQPIQTERPTNLSNIRPFLCQYCHLAAPSLSSIFIPQRTHPITRLNSQKADFFDNSWSQFMFFPYMLVNHQSRNTVHCMCQNKKMNKQQH